MTDDESIENQIIDLMMKLHDSDWRLIEIYEYSLTDPDKAKEYIEKNREMFEQREKWRDEIRALKNEE